MKKYGVAPVPVITFKGETIDGVVRENAAQQLGLALPEIEWDGKSFNGDPDLLRLYLQVHRAHLTPTERVARADELLTRLGKRGVVSGDTGRTRERLARLAGVGEATAQRFLAVKRKAPDLIPVMKEHGLTANRALQVSTKRELLADPTKKSAKDALYNLVRGDSGDLLHHAFKLYAPQPKARVADLTYGKGVFWRLIDVRRYRFQKSDLLTCPDAPYDLRNLPRKLYPDGAFDLVALDPPFFLGEGAGNMEANYQNRATTDGFGKTGLLELYEGGLKEICRILKPGGLTMVKCKDQIAGGPWRQSQEVFQIAMRLGFAHQDTLYLDPFFLSVVNAGNQKHFANRISVLWIFRKPR